MKRLERQFVVIFVILIILLVGLVSWIVVYKVNYDKSFFTYNGFDFKWVGNSYEIKIFLNELQAPYLINLRSDPRELEEISIDSSILNLEEKNEIFITIDPNANLTGVTTMAVLEIDKIIDNKFLYNIPVNASFTEEYELSSLEIVTCGDATDEIAVLWFRLEDETRVYKEGECFIVAGVEENDLIRAADRIVYSLLGIMEI